MLVVSCTYIVGITPKIKGKEYTYAQLDAMSDMDKYHLARCTEDKYKEKSVFHPCEIKDMRIICNLLNGHCEDSLGRMWFALK